MTTVIDDDAVVWSAPATELASRPLVVLMHGRGSHEGDLPSLIPMLPTEPVYASLRAPLPFEEGDGYSWFAAAAPGRPAISDADAATDAVLQWLDRVAPAQGVAAVGFSQGGAMALHLMRTAPERFRSFVNFAGFAIPGEVAEDERLLEIRPPVFWGRDPRDPIIPEAAIVHTRSWLPQRSTLTERQYPGIGHSISRDEATDAGEFLRETLGL